MEENRTENYEVNQIDIFKIAAGCLTRIRQSWFILLLIVCVCTGGSVVKEKRQYSESYLAAASFIVTTGGKEYTNISSYYNKVTMKQLSTSFPFVLTSDLLQGIVAEDLGASSVPGFISASVLEETNLFQINVTASNPQVAYDILQSVIKNYPKVAKYVFGDTELTLIDETGVPTEPTAYPDYKNAAMQGFLLGAIICIVIVLLQVLMRNTVKGQEDLKTFLNVKYLAGIPQEHKKKRSKENTSSVLLDSESITPLFKESLRTLQIRFIRLMTEKKYKSLVISSALAGEGKTTVSCNLAYSLAKKGYKVLLIDGDLRNPSIADNLELKDIKHGVVDVLKGDVKAKDILVQYKDTKLHVLPGGKPEDHVSKLYRNGNLRDLVNEYSKTMDYIIIDTPPCAMMSDASLAADCADAVLLVIRQDYARREKILDGVEMLSSSKAPLIGCVINGEDLGSGSYGKYDYGKYGYGRYGYGYGYGRYGYGRYGYGYGEKPGK